MALFLLVCVIQIREYLHTIIFFCIWADKYVKLAVFCKEAYFELLETLFGVVPSHHCFL
jgi:hypothetical protein